MTETRKEEEVLQLIENIRNMSHDKKGYRKHVHFLFCSPFLFLANGIPDFGVIFVGHYCNSEK
jgi:hypothetical protein